MDELLKSRLRQDLLDIQTAVHDALALLGADTTLNSSGVVLPAGRAACTHPRRVVAMGGFWSCPDCGTEGREEVT